MKPWQDTVKSGEDIIEKSNKALLELFDYFYNRETFAKVIEKKPTLSYYDNIKFKPFISEYEQQRLAKRRNFPK